MELRDKNGLTEREYLAQYRADKYPRPSVTVDVCIFSRAADGALRTLLIRRGGRPRAGGGDESVRADALPRWRLQRNGAGPARLDPLLRLCGPYRGRSAHGPRRGRCGGRPLV